MVYFYYMDAILNLNEPGLKYLIEAGEKIPDNVIEKVILAYGPLNDSILWGKGTGNTEADEKLLREVDAKKARMVQFLIDNGFKFEANKLLICYMMRCVEVARVLLEAGVNPNGNNLSYFSTLWMLRDGMRTYSHSQVCWNILTEMESLLIDWCAVEYTFEHSCIYCSSWPVPCYGKPFAVGDDVEWTGHPFGIWRGNVEQYVDFVRECHCLADDYIIRGKITRIYAEVEDKEKHATHYEKANQRLLEQDRADGNLKDKSLFLWGYYIHLKNVEVDYNPNTKFPCNQKVLEIVNRHFKSKG